MLRRHTAGESSLRVELQEPDFKNAVQRLLERFPELAEHFDLNGNAPRANMPIFLNHAQITDFSSMAVVLRNGDELLMVPALAGG